MKKDLGKIVAILTLAASTIIGQGDRKLPSEVGKSLNNIYDMIQMRAVWYTIHKDEINSENLVRLKEEINRQGLPVTIEPISNLYLVRNLGVPKPDLDRNYPPKNW